MPPRSPVCSYTEGRTPDWPNNGEALSGAPRAGALGISAVLGCEERTCFFPANRVFWDISQRPGAFEDRGPFMQNPLRKARMPAS
jgi:hypothetical protein